MKTRINDVKGIQYIELINNKGMKITLSSLGASILSLYINNDSMISSPANFNDMLNPKVYQSKTIGLIAGRIKEGKVKVNDNEYQFDLNEGENTLHGGKKGISNQVFAVQRFQEKDYYMVIYSFKMPKKFNPLPGNIDIFVVYTIFENENTFRIDFKARSDSDSAISLTNHAYFCLGERNLDNIKLRINADKYVEPDKHDLIMGEEKNVLGCLDFRKEKPVMKDINNIYLISSKTKGYDHYFVFKDNKNPISLSSLKYKLDIETDFKGVVIYSDNYEDGIVMNNTTDLLHRGIAIEPEDHPHSTHLLKANENYERFIVYKFSEK